MRSMPRLSSSSATWAKVAPFPLSLYVDVLSVLATREIPLGAGYGYHTLAPIGIIHDVDEVHVDARERTIWELGRVVDELGDLFQPELLRTLAKHKHHSVDDVRLPRAIRSDDRVEAVMVRPDRLQAGVGLEVLELELRDDGALRGAEALGGRSLSGHVNEISARS